MIKVSVLYGHAQGTTFDKAYYCDKHIPMVRDKLGQACRRLEVDLGLGGAEPGSKPPFVAMAHMLFEDLESFQSSFGPHAEAILGDIPNYTDIEPTIQISELRTESGP